MYPGAWFQEQDHTLQNTPPEVCVLMSEQQSVPEMARVRTWHWSIVTLES